MTPTIPKRIAALPVVTLGAQEVHVPAFVAWVDGKPDFRIAEAEHLVRCSIERRCWTCGQKITGPNAAFVIGPMCAVNRVSSEPPSHADCARYAAAVCPFLVNPKKRRREGKMPDAPLSSAGIMLPRNPGVTLIWVTRHWSTFRAPGGILFRIGKPSTTEWYAEGREATRAEVLASIESGIPTLEEMAKKDGPEAEVALAAQFLTAMELVPS